MVQNGGIEMQEYDAIVIGGGPGGYLAAERLGHAGLKVLLIEKHKIGGVCLNEGCIPSKIFLNSANLMDHTKDAHLFGVMIKESQDVILDQKFLVNRKNQIVNTLTTGVKSLLKRNNVQIVNHEAVITGKNQNGFHVKAGNETYTGKRLVIATGSSPIVPFGISGLKEQYDQGFIVTSSTLFDIEKIPRSLVIIGGGIIGLEMAAFFNSAGTKVTVIEMLESIAGQTDSKISKILLNNLQKRGIQFQLNSKVTAFEDKTVVFEQKGKTEKITVDKVLLAIGRRPNIQGYGLESISVNTEKGAIITDSKMRTNIQNVYAVGDVNGISMLAHTAYREAEVAVNTILGIKDEMTYDAIPNVIYSHPEVASVGDTEENAKNKGLSIQILELPLVYSGRYLAENIEHDGVCRLIVNLKTNTLIGAHIIGSYASEYIVLLSSLIHLEVDVNRIKKLVFPHPTVGEIIRETIWTI
jgi:dihydrolipoamide dehydrogenase